MKSLCIGIVVFFFLGLLSAKERTWLTGKFIDASSERVTTGDATTTGTVSSNGNVQTNTHERRQDEQVFAIDAGDRIITVTHSIPVGGGGLLSYRLGKGVNLNVGDEVKFSLAGDSVYVLDASGKERKLRVARVSLKKENR